MIDPYQLSIMDLSSRIIKTFDNIDAETFQINLDYLQPGVYFVILKYDNQIINSKKVFKY